MTVMLTEQGSIPFLKKSIRNEVLKKRDVIPLPVKNAKDRAIKDRLLGMPEFKNASRVLFYASFRTETGTTGIIREALLTGKKVMLPRVNADTLKIYEIKGMEELSPGYMGIPEPPVSELRGLEDVDIVVVPGVAFDTSGYRLGYGKGYYDRMLSAAEKRCPVWALAYEEQVVESIPHEAHDVRVDIIITDKRIIECHGQGKD